MRPRSERRALLAFIAVEALAAVIWLALGRRQWFIADEWAFLADRDGADLHDLFRPHNEHWSTIPVLVYRGLWHLVGLRSYVPYLVPVITAHLAAAALLRAVMRRSGVQPWIATSAAAAFALFGSGRFNIIYPFQIGFSGALALGLAAMLIADRDGGLTRADVAGILCCVVSLLFAGISVVLIASVALAVFIRRGPTVAAAYALPPAAVFLLWAATAGKGEFERSGTLRQVAGFVFRNVRETLDALGMVPGAALLLAGVLVIGVALALRAEPRMPLRQVSLPLSLLVGAGAFALTTGLGRGAGYAESGTGAAASRYLHITAALMLPALALGASAIAARWRLWLVPMALLFATGVTLNVRDAHRAVEDAEPDYRAYRDKLLVTAWLPLADELPRSLPPENELRSIWVTMGWLVDGAESGRIPEPGDDADVDRTALVADLVLRSVEDDESAVGCEPLGPEPRPLEAGQRLLGRGPVVLVLGATPSSPAGLVDRYFLPGYAPHVMIDGLQVGVRSGDVQLCPAT
jgi:hypothetical protein